MKKVFLLWIAITPSYSYPQSLLNLKNTKIDFSKPNGTISGESISVNLNGIQYETTQLPNDLHINFNRLTLLSEETELRTNISKDSTLNALDYFSADIQKLKVTKNTLNFRSSLLDIKIQDEIQEIKGLNLSCIEKNPKLNLLDNCLQKTKFNASMIKIAKANQETFTRSLGLKTKVPIDKIKDIKLSINDHDYSLQFKIKYFFPLTFKSFGEIINHESSNEIEIKVKKFNYKFINLRYFLFKVLKEQKIENLRTKGYSIFLKLRV